MYVITKNNPYYPDVEYRETIEEARAARDAMVADIQKENGEYACKVTIGLVVETVEVLSDW